MYVAGGRGLVVSVAARHPPLCREQRLGPGQPRRHRGSRTVEFLQELLFLNRSLDKLQDFFFTGMAAAVGPRLQRRRHVGGDIAKDQLGHVSWCLPGVVQ